MNTRFAGILACALIAAWPRAGSPQQTTGQPLELAAMQQAAIDRDPRLAQLQLLAAQTELRLRNIAVARRPSIGVEAQAQYQSDVPRAPEPLPVVGRLFSPPKATYDTALWINHRLVDPTIDAQGAVERAQLAERQASVRTALFALRQQVNDAYFAAAVLQARAGALAAAITDLEARLRETTTRVGEGAAIPADAAAIEATLLLRQQDQEEMVANQRAALQRLAILTGERVTETDTLGLPDIGPLVAQARRAPDQIRSRPEYEQFSRTRERIARQRDVTAAQERPRISSYAKVGYGRPGLNFISDESEPYGLAGLRVEWNAWTWGSAAREREALAIQQQVVAADEAAFAKGVDEATENDQAAVDRLQNALVSDQRIVTLREQIERSTEARFQEGVVTASEYLDRSAELLEARSARAVHQVQLAQAGARLLTTLGLEVR